MQIDNVVYPFETPIFIQILEGMTAEEARKLLNLHGLSGHARSKLQEIAGVLEG